MSLAAVGLFALVGLAIGAALVGRERANTQRNYERAEQNRRDAQDVLDRFGTRLAERLADVPGAAVVRQELLHETLRYYHKFVEQAGDDPALRAELATTYGKIGSLQAELGNWDQAESAQRQAVSLFQRLADESHDIRYRRQAAVCQSNLAAVVAHDGRPAEALALYGEAIERQSQCVAEAADQSECQSELALSLNNLGLLHSELGDTEEAAAAFRRAIELQEFVRAQSPDSVDSLRVLAASYNNLGGLLVEANAKQAADWYREALECQTRAALIDPTDLRLQSDVALSLNNLAGAQSRLGDLEAAAKSYGRAIEIQRQLVDDAPAHPAYRRDLSVSHNNLGLVRNRQRRSDEAAAAFHEALKILQPLAEDNPEDVDARSSIGGIHNNLGMMLESQGELTAAAEQFALAIRHQTAAFDRARSVVRLRQFLNTHHANLARVLAELERFSATASESPASRDDDGYESFVADLLANYPEIRRPNYASDSP
ncbi:MAG: tetratricopeptide repeat protein [Pirellulaceae bacterium]